ncbi:Holliday junction resolvase RuvX [Beijerinckia indica]|uniref:Putative pre-16S rRNA nuclease n=1 Tax=Beijerinckia indica subsp. indica (strain ATCC 9039 / DSM 1715 / NCIMB 8712) TaxID=395963 RepID=YQGF_BEII9|nr:Holliday junction resolvase RuvX [Beijerinckia indica]B2IEC1.1 RecName: Full=Putative pre-16S rRNA nuclease [Beijerinckia indica subsp. indica ATCC 9039]ACB95519.1 Holliday junction resolvase YqgF [Beijerinckia indica subsp. indica ATCC 9039]
MATKVLPLVELKPLLGPRQRLIGIDLGTKTIGLSLSDVERRIATPLETIRRTKFTKDAERLLALADQFDVAAFVIGLPLNMDGSAGPRVQATEAFVRSLSGLTSRPFCYWDERLSTAAVTRDLIAQDASRAKRAAVVDKLAAAFILQGALDRLAWVHETADKDLP